MIKDADCDGTKHLLRRLLFKAERICHDNALSLKGLDIRSRPLTFQRKSCRRVEAFRDGYCRSGFLDSYGFDCQSDFFLHGLSHWRALRLGLGNRSLSRRSLRYLACLTAFG
jgi:hypothetical protein